MWDYHFNNQSVIKFNELNYCKCKLPSYDHEIWSNCWKSALYSNCYDRFIHNFTNSLCFNYCPLECDSYAYDLSFSSLEYPDKTFYDKNLKKV